MGGAEGARIFRTSRVRMSGSTHLWFGQVLKLMSGEYNSLAKGAQSGECGPQQSTGWHVDCAEDIIEYEEVSI